jgi:hypothetical protein
MTLLVQTTRQAKLDSVSFDTLLSQQRPFSNPECKFDLTTVQLVTPAALVQLTAACHALKRDGRDPKIVVRDASVRSYLGKPPLFGCRTCDIAILLVVSMRSVPGLQYCDFRQRVRLLPGL